MSRKTEPVSVPAAPSTPRKRKTRTFVAKIRLVLLSLILLVLILVQAPIYPRVAGVLLRLAAWRDGASLSIGSIEGSLFEPLVLRNTVWNYSADSGAVTRIEVGRARAWLAWSSAFPKPVSHWLRSAASALHLETAGNHGAWFHELELDGVTAKMSLPPGEPGRAGSFGMARWLRSSFGSTNLSPSVLRVRSGDLIVERGSDYLRAVDASFSFSEISPGTFRASQLIWNGGGGKRTFRSVHALTSLQDARATFASLRLAPDVMIETFSFVVADIAKGRLNLSTRLSAFGGNIEAEAETGVQNNQLRIDITGGFSKINVAGLAAFLSLGEAAGGTFKEGHFSFRGTPGDLAGAEATLRIEAGAFQWETRQWDSLVLGLSLFDQRLNIPEFRLRQGKNQLTLKGSVALARHGLQWWERQFDFKVDADIRNLTDLSALVLPDFKYAAGQLFVSGSVSAPGAEAGKPQSFDGQLIVSGTDLQWRTTPIENLQAALVFRERELQIISAQFIHDEDYLRGTGQVSLTDGTYAGQWRLSARDLAKYKAMLTPHILPASLGGGMDITWSGKGGAAGHDGKFSARLRRLHLLGPGGTLPLDAECSGAYRPGEIQFENFRLAENGTSLTAGVSIGPSAVNVRDLRVMHRNRLCLKGDAFLALDLWQRWPDVTFTRLLNGETVNRVTLEATDLDLRLASRLTGIEWPLAGTVTGKVQADGALGSLTLAGSASLMRGTLPLDWQGNTVRDVNASFSLEGARVRLDSASGKHPVGDFSLGGSIDLRQPFEPSIEAEGIGTNESQPFRFTVKGSAVKPEIATDKASPSAVNSTVKPTSATISVAP